MATTGPTSRPPIRRRRRLVARAALVLATLGGLGLWWTTREAIPSRSPYAGFRAHARAVLSWSTSPEFEQIGVRLAFSPDGRVLATGGEDDVVRTWDLATGAPRSVLRHPTKVEAVEFSADGKALIAEDHGSIPMLWLNQGRLVEPEGPVVRPGSLNAVFGPARTLATFWDAATGAPMGEPLVIPPRVAVRSGDRLELAPPAADADTRLKLWHSAVTRDRPGVWAWFEPAGPVLIAPDGKAVAWPGGRGQGYEVCEIATGKFTPIGPNYPLMKLAFAFSADGRTFAAGAFNGEVVVLDRASGSTWKVASAPNRAPLAFSPDGRLLATVGPRAVRAAPAWVGRLPAFARAWLDPYVSKNARLNQPDDEVLLWDVARREPVAVLRGHRDMITGIAFAPDGRTLATADWEGMVNLWKVP